MIETIEVHIQLGGNTRLVGHCRYTTKAHSQSSVFEYADEWLSYSKAFALDPANLPLNSNSIYRSSEKSALPGAIRDSAPDRWGRQLIRRALRKSGEKRSLSQIDYLLAVSDPTRIGALRFRLQGETEFSDSLVDYQVPPLLQLPALLDAANAVHNNTEAAEDLKLLLNAGSPLGGARPKSAVIDKCGTLAIAKFPKPDDYRSIPHGEILALALARKSGINAANAQLQNVAGRPVALIERFDRANDGKRIPFLSAMSLLGLSDGDIATYTDIAECIRMYSSAPTEDLHELWRRIVFGIMISNLDDHLRNHGFLYDGRQQWRLAPAYDLNPVPLEEKARELTTWIFEEGPEASIELARSAAPYFALKNDQAQKIITEVSSAIANWRDVAGKLGMSSADIDEYASAFGSAQT